MADLWMYLLILAVWGALGWLSWAIVRGGSLKGREPEPATFCGRCLTHSDSMSRASFCDCGFPHGGPSE